MGYQVKADKLSEFEKIYLPNGAWTGLFKKSTGYLGTELLLDEKDPHHSLTIDRWSSKGDYESFHAVWGDEYRELDEQCEGLTEKEFLLGRWNLA